MIDPVALLETAGLRVTRPRVQIARLLFGDGQDRHVTAEQIYGQLSGHDAPIALATVYNTLGHFVNAGLLRPITARGSDAHCAAPPDDSAALLVAAFSRCLGRPLPKVVHLQGHRWRYALAPEAAALPVAVADERLRLLLCGDGLSGGRVEGAFSSGLAAARRLLAMG